MIIDFNSYRSVHFQPLLAFFEKRKENYSIIQIGCEYSFLTSVPVIVSYGFLYEITKDDKLLKNINDLIEFYRYSEVKNFNGKQ